MVIAKTDLFEKNLQEQAIFFKALAHPARIQIIKYLAETRICLTGDISDMFPISRTTVNQHMRELKNAGLVIGHEKDGKIYYCLDIGRLEEMRSQMSIFLEDIHIPEDFCCECGEFKHSYQ